jgi:hypothetical protein
MNKPEKMKAAAIFGLLHGEGNLPIPKPFERDIFLFDTHVAGTSHVEDIKELEPHLNAGAKLDLFPRARPVATVVLMSRLMIEFAENPYISRLLAHMGTKPIV